MPGRCRYKSGQALFSALKLRSEGLVPASAAPCADADFHFNLPRRRDSLPSCPLRSQEAKETLQGPRTPAHKAPAQMVPARPAMASYGGYAASGQPAAQPAYQLLSRLVLQGLAVASMVVPVGMRGDADGAGTGAVSVHMVSVLICLLGESSPVVKVIHIYRGRRSMPMSIRMIPASGEILGDADSGGSAGPSLSSTHCGLQRQCGAEGGKRSAVSGSPAQLASPIRLGSMSARQAAGASRPARLKGKRYGRLWPAGPSTDSHLVYPPYPQGRQSPGRRSTGATVSAPNPGT